MKKCDEQVKIVDEQASGVGNPAELTTESTEDTEEKIRFCSKWKSAESRGRFLYQLEISSVFSVLSVV